MQVQELMNRNIQLATPNESLRAVAERMADCDIGYMPVGENDRLIGAVTDRDIAIRGVGAGRTVPPRSPRSTIYTMGGVKPSFCERIIAPLPK